MLTLLATRLPWVTAPSIWEELLRKYSRCSNKVKRLDSKEDKDASVTISLLMTDFRHQPKSRYKLSSKKQITWMSKSTKLISNWKINSWNATVCNSYTSYKLRTSSSKFLKFWRVLTISLYKLSIGTTLDSWSSYNLFKFTRREYSSPPSCNSKTCHFHESSSTLLFLLVKGWKEKCIPQLLL